MATIAVGATATFAVLQPVKVLRRHRIAPGYSLVDSSGHITTSDDARGSVTLYSFLPLECGGTCAEVESVLAEVAASSDRFDLGEADLEIVTIALDSASPAELVEREVAWGSAIPRRWLAGDPTVVRTVVGGGFRHWFEHDERLSWRPGLTLVDGAGMIRAEYRDIFDADQIMGHLVWLGEEARRADGPLGFVYDAAHLFSCYG